MWTFGNELDFLPGIERDKDGNIIFDLTEEEQREVRTGFKMFNNCKFHPDFVDDFRNGITAFALSNYAKSQIMLSELEPKETKREILICRAIAATAKASSIYPLPIHIYDFACYIEKVGKADVAKEAFQIFLEEQSKFEPTEYDDAFMGQRNINEAIQYAKEKTTH